MLKVQETIKLRSPFAKIERIRKTRSKRYKAMQRHGLHKISIDEIIFRAILS